MTLSTGFRLGPYEILSPIGAGGMGEVYRAKDTRLERAVAIKVLPEKSVPSADARQRFEREAKTISQLSHPHICALYDVGREGETEYLVMELLEGETLGERLAKGALPLEQTLRYGVEIADALDKAQRQGIVHRDLKPGNVMLTKSGVKLLDFGLAKAVAPAGPRGSLTSLPTQQGLTQEGTILGTFQYMAPEQLEGKEADARTDIFAFGATLYEMATGRKAFSGTSQASLISSIMKEDPAPISAVQPMAPAALDRVVKTCLAKDPEDRWQSAGDVGKELRWIGEGSAAGLAAPTVVSSRRRRREVLAWCLAAAGLLGAAAALLARRSTPTPQPLRFTFSPPAGHRFARLEQVATSPDGRRLAFVAYDLDGNSQLWVQGLDALSARPLDGTGFARSPFWSPDGRAIAFFQGGRLRRIDAEGGTIQTICEGVGSWGGGSWGARDEIVFGATFGAPLLRVPSSGGKPAPVTALETARGDAAHLFPSFLPDGRHFVFAARNVDPRASAVALGDLDSKASRILWRADSSAVWSPLGYLLFAREGTLFAQRFDARRLAREGEAASVTSNIQFFTENNRVYVSAGGDVLAYGLWQHDRRLVWVDRQGRELGTLGPVAHYEDVRISPSGDRVAVSIRNPSEGWNLDVWVFDVRRGIASRVSTERFDELHPIWSPDGQRLFYGSDRAGFYDLYSRPASGGPEVEVLRTTWDKFANDVTPDGSGMVFGGSPAGANEDVWLLPLAGERTPKPMIETKEFLEFSTRLSPDGRWMAFASEESGRMEIFVQPFPSGPKRQVSSSGGFAPAWSRDGGEIYYRARDGRVTAVAVRPGASGLEVGQSQALFSLESPPMAGFDPRAFDVGPDGRFLVLRAVEESRSDPFVVDVHWTARLKR
jgi:eukaryotic-like serine/threonine-protein kinase